MWMGCLCYLLQEEALFLFQDNKARDGAVGGAFRQVGLREEAGSVSATDM